MRNSSNLPLVSAVALRSAAFAVAALIMTVTLTVVSCGRPAAKQKGALASTPGTFVSPENAAFVRRTGNGVLDPARQWYLKTSVGAYQRIGKRDPKWDAAAVEALETFALIEGLYLNEDTEDMRQRLGIASSKAYSVGCTDPMIHYLWCRFALIGNSQVHYDFSPEDYERCAGELATSDYPPIRKFVAYTRTMERYQDLRLKPPHLQTLAASAEKFLKEAVVDPEMPDENLYEACHTLFRVCTQAGVDRHDVWTRLEPPVRQKLGDRFYAHLLEGLVELQWATAARGTGFADTVSEEAWRLMKERLGRAHHALDQAWNLNPNDWRGPNLMMEVVYLESSSYEEMEKWFQRSMHNNPDDGDACGIKLHYLAPKWGGSKEAMVAFARQCLTNMAWTPAVAEIVPRAYGDIGLEIPDSKERTAYWRQPEVWTDIKAAYERLLPAYPSKSTLREDFEQWGVLCGKKEEAAQVVQAVEQARARRQKPS